MRVSSAKGMALGATGFQPPADSEMNPPDAPGRRRAGFASGVSQLDAGNGALAQRKWVMRERKLM